MRKLILYMAISLDGKISGPGDDVSWLDAIPNPDQTDYGYADFQQEIDTTIMGRRTYDWVMEQDMPFPYPDTENYVFTGNAQLRDNEYVGFVSADHVDFIRDLKLQGGKDIWLIGGAKVNQLCLEANLIDEFRLFVMPIILGKGTTMFDPEDQRQSLELTRSKVYQSGVMELVYQPKG